MTTGFHAWVLALAAGGLVSASASAGASSDWKIDLTKPLPASAAAWSVLYDEAVENPVNFAYDQKDSRLADLFSPAGKSELCFPTALAQGLTYLRATGQFPNLAIPTVDATDTLIDPSQVIRELARLCKTDATNGTSAADAFKCTASIIGAMGYATDQVIMISANALPNSQELPIQVRPLIVDDIKNYVRAGYAVLLDLGWYKYNEQTRTFMRSNGHFVSVIGFRSNTSWGADEVELKIVNPDLHYDTTGTLTLGDTVLMSKIDHKPGIVYPVTTDFTLTGQGFGSLNLVDRILVFRPH